ncbi:hypothetical protein [Nannocystis pusilla]|uniref:Uncharacterized protein n=1 Tax=Nannocystis pusilla TaxID=889268 RepID=A0ABS7U0G7_9BACT|nr:hypothetical protein [Nannocystis pusilla]MBZ5713949.1 hypothetical protein [Nannocystis pusilla]
MDRPLAALPDLADVACVVVEAGRHAAVIDRHAQSAAPAVATVSPYSEPLAGSAESVASVAAPSPSSGDLAPLPVALTPFRDRGHYRGAFAWVADLGNILRPVLGIRAGLPRAERERITRELCLRGDLWITVQCGVVHVFGRPGSDADLCLAGERPPLVDFDPRPRPTELRRQVQT